MFVYEHGQTRGEGTPQSTVACGTLTVTPLQDQIQIQGHWTELPNAELSLWTLCNILRGSIKHKSMETLFTLQEKIQINTQKKKLNSGHTYLQN